MANFATAVDLAAMLQRTFTTDESAAAVVLLDLASAAIRGECHQTFDYVVGDVAVLYGTWASVLPLPERPVSAVTSVSLNGVALVADVDYWWPGRNFLARGPRPATTSTHDIARAGDWAGPTWR